MKQITFNKVKIKNFLSIGNDPIELSFKKGITIITGENKDKGGKNGIGKSTISDAIFWCLFGNTIRELKKDKIQHDKNDEICEVILDFTVSDQKNNTNYVITRQLSPAKIEILSYIDDKKTDLTLSTLPKNDEFVKSLICANEEVFNNAVIMSANNTLPFMAQKKTEKRKFIEGILQLNIFSDMLLKARSLYNDKKKENDLFSNNFINEQKNLSVFTKQVENAEIKKQEKIDKLNESIDHANDQIKNIKKEILNYQINDNSLEIKELQDKKKFLKDKLTELNEKYRKIEKESLIYETEINQLVKEKQKLKNSSDICPTCNREYSKDSLDKKNERCEDIDTEINEKNELKKKNDALLIEDRNNISKIENGIEKIDAKIQKNNNDRSNVAVLEQKIKNYEDNIGQYNKTIEQIKNEDNDLSETIEETKTNIQKLEKELTEIKKNIQILDTVKFIVSEEGVKTFIVKKIIKIFNDRLNFYLKYLDAPCKCVFDESFDETIYNDQGKECSYFNFSGGERKRIDTAILFTFQDILRCHSGTSYSINIYDELFDSALDDKGIDKILELLKTKVEKYDESIYVITHKNNTKTNIDNVIFLEKKDGVTKILKQ